MTRGVEGGSLRVFGPVVGLVGRLALAIGGLGALIGGWSWVKGPRAKLRVGIRANQLNCQLWTDRKQNGKHQDPICGCRPGRYPGQRLFGPQILTHWDLSATLSIDRGQPDPHKDLHLG